MVLGRSETPEEGRLVEGLARPHPGRRSLQQEELGGVAEVEVEDGSSHPDRKSLQQEQQGGVAEDDSSRLGRRSHRLGRSGVAGEGLGGNCCRCTGRCC